MYRLQRKFTVKARADGDDAQSRIGSRGDESTRVWLVRTLRREAVMAIPRKNADLVGWGGNFDTKYTANPVLFGGTAAMATEFHNRYVAFVDANTAAGADATRSKALLAVREAAKEDVLEYGRMLYAQIQANINVPDESKVELGIVVPDRHPTPVDLGETAPFIGVSRVFGRDVHLIIRNAETMKRKKVPGAIGVNLYRFIGATPPAGTDGWVSDGNITKPEVIVQFDAETVTPGTLVHFTACWYSRAGKTSFSCSPVSARIGFEGAEPIAA
jgi:hypothetical protein